MDHDHGNGEHGHSHPHAENYSARAHPEYVVLDIGEQFGALIVHTDAEMHGVEVEISLTGEDDNRTHKDVLERKIDGRAAYTAVFDKITEGEYTLWVDDVARARGVAIAAGEIAELDWTTSSAQVRQAGSPASG